VYAYAALCGLREVRKFNLERAVLTVEAMKNAEPEEDTEDSTAETAVRLNEALAPSHLPPVNHPRIRRSRFVG
jgi:hypothetical protein